MTSNTKHFLTIAIAFLGIFCTKPLHAQFSYMGTYDGDGVPNYLVVPGDVVSQSLMDRINTSLPEWYSVPTYNPQYLQGAPHDIKLTQAADVWVTFVSEGASYRNSLGFYTYSLSAPPTTAPAYSNIHVVFPNCSLPGSGGNLSTGSKVYLGNFPANTGIGFVCIADGFNGSVVTAGNWVLFSTPGFNPEPDTSLRHHNVLLYDAPTQNVVVGFEDVRRDQGSDQDFNDLLFYTKVTPSSALDTTGLNLTSGSGSSSGGGGGGGLESESLCGLVSKRDFNRIKNNFDNKINYAVLPVFTKSTSLAKTTGTSRLQTLVPQNLEAGDVPRITSPQDLLSLTAAVDVFSIDYTNGDHNKAVVLGMTTLNRPYNHTKSVCDRFRGSSLMSTEEITIQDIKFVRYLLKREDGDLEYAIAFTAGTKAGGDAYNIQTNWLLSDYQANDTVYNFQVWSIKPHYTVKLVNDILNNLAAAKKLQQLNTDFKLPKAFIINGKRVKENLVVTLNNYSTTSDAKIVFEERVNENAGVTNREVPVTLTQGENNTFNIPIKDGYEYSGTLYLDGEKVDEVYFADGNWGIDYDSKYTKVAEYNPDNNFSRVYTDDEFPVYRSPTLKATSTDYITIYKSIRSGFEKADLTAYHSLKFFASGTGSVVVRLTKESIAKYKDQFFTTIELDPNGKEYNISFDDFTSKASAGNIDPIDVRSVEFTMSMYGVNTAVNLFIDRMSFSTTKVASTKGLSSKATKVYPNPNNGQFQLQFNSTEDKALTLKVTDIIGRTIYTQQVDAKTGSNEVSVNMQGSAMPSILFVSLEGEGVKYETSRVNIK